ncbi:MAG: NUDIX domain-containing protein [Cyanothece sp. SIO1E1]|nr:NUDIX domain-containing protein [Cyanothece sp. SIO1E1]
MIVLRYEQSFLLLERAKNPHIGKMVPVGGKLEPFEDPYTAALRETKEETGISLDQLQYAGVLIESSPSPYNWQCNIYVADIPYQDPPPCDEGILKWVQYQDIPNILTPPTDWQIYQYIMRKQIFAFNAVYNADLELIRMVDEIEGKVVVGKGL